MSDEKKEPPFRSAVAVAEEYRKRLHDGTLPQLFKLHGGLGAIEVGPGLITVFAAPPGAGKTALIMQLVTQILLGNEDQYAYIAIKDMSFEELLKRQIIAISNVESRIVQYGTTDQATLDAIDQAIEELRPALERTIEVCEPMSLETFYMLKDKPPAILVVDYLQLFNPGDQHGISYVMQALRALAKAGWCIIAASATSRGDASKKGIEAFRDSSEIEFNMDRGYLLLDKDPESWTKTIEIKCVKNRAGLRTSFELLFDGPRMQFVPCITDFDEWSDSKPPGDL